MSSQHTISELIGILETIRNTHGDLDVVYWDQDQSVTFDNFTDDTVQVRDEKLYFGGFHVNGSNFHKLS